MPEAIDGSNERTESDVPGTIFKIETGQDSGTGFLVYDHEHILTAHHVVKSVQQKKVTVRDVRTKEIHQASVQLLLENWDVALLRLDEPLANIQPLTLSQQKLDPGTEFRTYGFPTILKYHRWHLGKISGEDDGKYNFAFRASYPDRLDGLSGAPVFILGDKTYAVVGIVRTHGPDNLQMGTIVPSAGFYDKLLLELQSTELTYEPWCYVVLSQTDKLKDLDGNPYTLRQAIDDAIGVLQNDPLIKKDLRPPEFIDATDLVENADAYKGAISKLCRAKIAIFDVTYYEPVVMLLLGIRSVVRRGITIASSGNFGIGDVINFPFGIKEVSIISHTEKQQTTEVEENRTSYIIQKKILEGRRQLETIPQYLDLPAFDAVRNLPPAYREPDTDKVLVLCPYSKNYTDNNWRVLQQRLGLSLKGKIAEESTNPASKEARVIRILDVISPRLVSQTIYEAIRRTDLCIADWTEWRPNVFFELGVRLAVTNVSRFTVCIIEGRYRELVKKIDQNLEEFRKNPLAIDVLIHKLAIADSNEATEQNPASERYSMIAPQCERLFELFHPLEYNAPFSSEDPEFASLRQHFPFHPSVYKDMMSYYKYKEEGEIASKGGKGRAPNFTYEIIEKKIDVDEEVISIPVYLELLRTVQLFEEEESKGQTALLYPGREELKRKAEDGIVERLLAAWYFINNEYSEEEIIRNDQLFNACQDIGPRLSRRLRLRGKTELANEIQNTIKSLKQKKEGQP